MALHVPAHHAGVTGDHHLMRNFLVAVGLAIALIVVVGVASTFKVSVGPTTGTTDVQQALVQFRAGERADWAAGVATEASSLIEFRAAER